MRGRGRMVRHRTFNPANRVRFPAPPSKSDVGKEADRDYAIGFIIVVLLMGVCAGLFIYTMLNPLAWS
jgi:hypothetical protein